MTTYPLPTLAATVTPAGITAPSYADILASLEASFQAIYGSDIVLDPSSQDGQMLAVFALAIHDCNQTAIGVFNSFSPTYAQGTQLSSLVKINGLARGVATYSTVVMTLVGVAGTLITNGVAADTAGNLWNLPASVTIPYAGSITVTATSQAVGAVSVGANTVTKMHTPVLGWQSVTNSAASVPGAPVEQDAALRQRQAVSTALAAASPLQALYGAIANITGVLRYAVYENPTGSTDTNGIPGHTIAAVVEGGSATTICQVIEQTKSLGTGTAGTTSNVVIDPMGVPVTIRYYQLTEVPIYGAITIKAGQGYVASTGAAILATVAAYIKAGSIGGDVYLNKLWGPANLYGDVATGTVGLTQAQLDILSTTYNVTAITLGTDPGSLSAADVSIAFTSAAQCTAANLTLTVT